MQLMKDERECSWPAHKNSVATSPCIDISPMAVQLHIFLKDTRVPNREAWQRAIEQLGFPVVLDPSLDLHRDKGYSPTTYGGHTTGFELYLEPANELVSAYPQIASRVGNRDQCVTFRWGGDLMECAAALSAAGALACVADGIYFYPDDNAVYDVQAALAAIRRELSSI
jgi:hypothetical protein